MNRRYILALSIVLLALIGWKIYSTLMPSSPDLTPVDNLIADRSGDDWKSIEKKVVKEPLKSAYFGDLHVHTKFSFDAFIGGATAGPDEAYQFAKGQPIEVLNQPVKIVRPLDFAAITDHAEYLGEMYSTQRANMPRHFSLGSIALRSIGRDTAKQQQFFKKMRENRRSGKGHPNFFAGYETTSSAWDEIVKAAEKHYMPGEFTTFIGYEWSKVLGPAHLHRNVIFKDAHVPTYPISAFEANDEVSMWESLEKFRNDGATVMAIPHNSNLSYGNTFAETQPDGSPIDNDYILTRHKNEPLVEIHQAKGSSEVHPSIWTEDEYADFEIYKEVENPDPNSYVRHVLKRGLKYKKEFGVNPYEYGFIGSTDTHNGTPGNTEEDDEYQGNHLFIDTQPDQRSTSEWVLKPGIRTAEAVNPGGLVGVWSRANTRAEIYESFERKETFATSGNRVQVRFFGGSGFDTDLGGYESMIAQGYKQGVPMGSYLKQIKDDPQFIIWAAKDPEGANLHQIQLIKGWYDSQGELQEKIYDVVTTPNPYTKQEDVVNYSTGALNEQYGSAELSTVWTDVDFDPSEEAFYYLRVLEVPTLRYTEWDKIRYGTQYDEDIKRTTIERAWTSPIWYSPNH